MKKIKLPKIKIASVFLPFVYLVVVVVGLILYFIALKWPSFDYQICLTIKGYQICSLMGLYISVLASLPGYVIVGTILNAFYYVIPVTITYFLVAGVSVLFYFVLGLYFEKLIKSRNDTNNLIKYLVSGIFVIVVILAFLLRLISNPIY